MALLIIVSFVAGLATVVSPCVLPVLPIVLATGVGGDRRRPYLVIAGLIASFTFFTLASVQIIQTLHLPSDALRTIAILVIALFGLTLLVPRLTVAFERLTARLPGIGARLAGPDLGGSADEGRSGLRGSAAGAIGSLATGAGLGLVWVPCAGPILGAITSLAVTAPGSLNTVILVAAYSLGAGLPLLAIALGGRVALSRLRLRSASMWAGRVFGVLVLATAGLMAVGADTAVTTALTNDLPDWTGVLQAPERVTQVQAALHDLGVGPAPSSQAGSGSGSSGLSVGPDAPDFTGIDHWLNSGPLTMSGLKGKVVLVDFWTYSCVNCIRTIPFVEGWYQKYASDGFVVVGVHTPEFAFEHDTANVAAALTRFGITYPVAQDNEFATWTAYNNEYWPADYLIDASGRIRDTHFGEGDYAKTDGEIRSLLLEAGKAALPSASPLDGSVPVSSGQTPETYLGLARGASYVSPLSGSGTFTFQMPNAIGDNMVGIGGSFDFQDEYVTAAAAGDQIKLSFRARDVYLVMSSDAPVSVTVDVQGGPGVSSTEDVNANGAMTVSAARLYHLVHLSEQFGATVTLTFKSAGVRCYAFTFGS